MSDYDDDYDDYEEPQDPALKGYNSTFFKVKHVTTQALKYGLMGAIAVGAMAAVGALVFGGGLLASLPFGIGYLAAAYGVSTGAAGAVLGATVVPAAMTGLTVGAIAGGAIGAVMGISSADEAADDEEDRLRDKSRMREMSAARANAMQINLEKQKIAMAQQEQMLGIGPSATPNIPFGQGRETGQGIV